MVLLVTERFSGDDRIPNAKEYLNGLLKDHPDPIARMKALKTEYKKMAYMSIQRHGEVHPSPNCGEGGIAYGV